MFFETENHKCLFGSSVNALDYFHQTDFSNNLLGMFDSGTGVSKKVIFDTNFIDGNLYKIDSCYDKTTKIWTITRTNLSGGADTETKTIDCTGYNFSFSIDTFMSRGFGDRFWDGCMSNLVLSVDGVVKGSYSLEGNLYDDSGNNNHITSTTIGLTQTITDTDGLYSYLFNEGFDHYTDDATGFIDLYVPYVSGSPVVSSVAGYTKQSEHPQASGITKKWNNIAPVFFAFAGLDRSDTDDFTALCRSSEYYDSSNPTFWHASELAPDTLQSFLEPTGDLHNTLFSGSTPNEYDYVNGIPQYDDVNGQAETTGEDETKVQDMLIYDTAKTKSEVLKIMKYFKKKVGV